MKESRGIRNNNPLNIRRTNTVWQGMKQMVTDKEFVEFKSMAWGYRAAWRTLFTYFYYFVSVKMPFTVETIINRWAPPAENHTKAYIKRVLRLSGLGGKENLLPPMNPKGVWKLSSLMAAMTVVECGIKPEEVDVEAIKEGYRLAFHESYPEHADRPEPEEDIVWDEYWDWSPLAFGE